MHWMRAKGIRAGQLEIPEIVAPGSYLVEIVRHGVFATGTIFLVVSQHGDDWLRCWQDGLTPEDEASGTLLKPECVSRINV